MAPFVHAFITLGLLAGTIVTAAPAGAAAPTCDGRMPTIIGSSDQERLYGTDGPDVIVTNGSRIVDAGGGADVVCMTGGDTLVDTGDHYETHQAEAVPMAHDIVIGTGGNDVVYSGREYRGDDAYAASYDNDDDIRLGAGDSTLFMEGRPTGDLDGGDGPAGRPPGDGVAAGPAVALLGPAAPASCQAHQRRGIGTPPDNGARAARTAARRLRHVQRRRRFRPGRSLGLAPPAP